MFNSRLTIQVPSAKASSFTEDTRIFIQTVLLPISVITAPSGMIALNYFSLAWYFSSSVIPILQRD